MPGTPTRFGWDALIGLVPWAGDVITAFVGLAILASAHRMRVPGVVQVRMLLNLAIDLLIGLVPFAGDIADVFWKANTKNMAMLERAMSLFTPFRGHGAEQGPPVREERSLDALKAEVEMLRAQLETLRAEARKAKGEA